MLIHFSVETQAGTTRTFQSGRSVVTFGRAKTSTVALDDPALSRTHCQLELEDGAVFVRDLNSFNGTFLGEERVDRIKLDVEDHVRIGTTHIVYHGLVKEDGLESAPEGTARWTAGLFRRKKNVDSNKSAGEVALRKLLALIARISGELSPERVLTRILDGAIELVDAERGFLVTVEESCLRIPVARDFWKKDIPSPAFALSRSIALEVVKRGESLLTDDAMRDERFDERVSVHDLKIRSVLCVPLVHEGDVIGAIYLDNRFTRRTFDRPDLEAIELLSEPAATALLNSELFEATERDRLRLRTEARRERRERAALASRLRQLERARGLRHDFSAIVGRSEAMRACLELADRFVGGDLALVIQGESGVGKELLARAIHGSGPRRTRPFVIVDGASIPSGLAEVELFGHEAGAFSGGDGERAGLLEQADGGTLFLDGLGDLDHEVQKGLLRVLETGEFRRLGASTPRRVDLRVLSAIQEDPADLVATGRLRADVFYRLKGAVIVVPALRDRIEDLGPLIDSVRAELDTDLEFEGEAMQALARHSWPGNVRELKNELRRLALTHEGAIRISDLASTIREDEAEDATGRDLKGALDALEGQMIEEALSAEAGNKTRAAERLGISRLGLRKKMARLGFDADSASRSGKSPELEPGPPDE